MNSHAHTGLILPHHGILPKLIAPLFIAPNASIIGEVTAGAHCSFWFSSVTRGDVHRIDIGEGTNIQDLSMLHVSYKKAPLKIGSHVTVGHSVILHGCTVGDRVLIGMGSVIMDNAIVGDDCVIGAGSLVTEGTRIPKGSLAFGRPAKVVRPLTPEEILSVAQSAEHYKKVAASYSGGPFPYEP